MSLMRFQFNVLCVAFIGLAIILPHPAEADPLPEPWQTKREQNNAISNRACNGDADAISEVKRRWAANDALMMNSAGYLKENCDPFSHISWEKVRDYQRRSALAGYPIAMSNYGFVLLRGENGVKRDTATGLALIDRAIEAGFGLAARNLAVEYATAEHLPQDLIKARANLRRAAAEQVSGNLLASAEDKIVEAEEKIAIQETPQESVDQYAALAVSTGDAVYGFAHDYANGEDAARRAVDECSERGGSSCQARMVLKGPACISYHYQPGQSVFGWGQAGNQSEAEARAAQECRIRNDNQTCEASVWSCNTRTEDPIEVVMEKPQPQETPATGAGCLITLEKFCNNVIGARYKHSANLKESISIYAVTKHRMDFPNCGIYSEGTSSISWYKNKLVDGHGIPAYVRNEIKDILFAYQKAVEAEYPGCGNREIRMWFDAARKLTEDYMSQRRERHGMSADRMMDYRVSN